MTLPLSKTLDPADFEDLAPELSLVDKHFTREREQHPMRRWEYAMALRALATWRQDRDYRDPVTVADVGGAGSPFRYMLQRAPTVIDPDDGESLAHYLTTPRWLDDESHPMLQQVVFCLSVLEHVDDLDQFLYHLSCLVAPGGLLFLTVDYCDDTRSCVPVDRYHFHWMRKCIFNPFMLGKVAAAFFARDFQPLGPVDYVSQYTPVVYDYSFASIALRRLP